MATEPIERVVERLTTDRAFRLKYNQDPDGALETYLSPEQIQAIKTGDGHQLDQLVPGDHHWNGVISTLCGPNPGP